MAKRKEDAAKKPEKSATKGKTAVIKAEPVSRLKQAIVKAAASAVAEAPELATPSPDTKASPESTRLAGASLAPPKAVKADKTKRPRADELHRVSVRDLISDAPEAPAKPLTTVAAPKPAASASGKPRFASISEIVSAGKPEQAATAMDPTLARLFGAR